MPIPRVRSVRAAVSPARLRNRESFVHAVRRGFTLIELLVIIGIMGLMVTVGIVSVRSGKGAARVKGATRDVFAAIRHARSTALVTGQPAIITYSTGEEDGEPVAKIEVTSAKLFDSEFDRSKAQTLTGDTRRGGRRELVHIEEEGGDLIADKTKGKSGDGEESVTEEKDGETVEDILFAPINTDIVKGMRLKVVVGDEELDAQETKRPTKISVFSNVDYLLGKFKSAKAEAKKKEEEEAKAAGKDVALPKADAEEQEPVSVVWETNGRVDPHQVWIYPDGKKPEDGLSIKIDRFGAAKVLPGDGKEED